jgi:hypothetical protein
MIPTTAPSESLVVPLDGLTEAELTLGFGGGELHIAQAEPGILVQGTFEGGVIDKSSRPGKIRLEPADPGRSFLPGRSRRWELAVTNEIPIVLRLDTGANRSMIDLSTLRVRRLELRTGASETHLKLPTAGATHVRIECGFAEVTVDVPANLAARIKGRVSLGSTIVDETRYQPSSEGWESADYGATPDRVDIEIAGGLGSVRIG